MRPHRQSRIDQLAPKNSVGNTVTDPAAQHFQTPWRACAAIPAGTWTSYGDIAELIGSHPVPVGVHLATKYVLTGWRVLTAEGRISTQFRWADGRTDDPKTVLAGEGLRLVGGRADPAQRLAAADLAASLGMDTETLPPRTATHEGLTSPAGRRFLDQLGDAHPEAAAGVLDVIHAWPSAGGRLEFGSQAEVSCFLMIDPTDWHLPTAWPAVIYPTSGTVEIVFQHMSRRPVFSDTALRKELRDRLRPAGVDIPDNKLRFRPSFPVALLTDPVSRRAILDALSWFAQTYRRDTEAAAGPSWPDDPTDEELDGQETP